jgi:hypothetical protein
MPSEWKELTNYDYDTEPNYVIHGEECQCADCLILIDDDEFINNKEEKKMNREIKFRAWDGKEMLPVQDLSQSSEYWTWLGKKDVALMQFTGLKDKNKVEIYESDIAKIKVGKIEYIGKVIYDNNLAMFQLEFKFDTYFSKDLYAHLETMEVIGNIHQNTRLCEH